MNFPQMLSWGECRLLAFVLVLPGFLDEDLATLVGEGRWDEAIGVATSHLEKHDQDTEVIYWLGHAWLGRGQDLLGGGRFATGLAAGSLEQAVAAFARIPAGQEGEFEDAKEWWAYARYLRGEREGLSDDLENWYASTEHGYPAFLRGKIGIDRREENAVLWVEKAVSVVDDPRPEYALLLAETLAGMGRISEAESAWWEARARGAAMEVLMSATMSLYPDATNASRRLSLIGEVSQEPGLSDHALVGWFRSHALYELGRIPEAIEAMSGADVGRTSESDQALAVLLQLDDRHQEVVELLAPRLSDRDEALRTVFLNSADALAQSRRFSESEAAYDLALAEENKDERAQWNRALMLSRAGHVEKSQEAWRELTSQYGGRADVLNDAALCAMGEERIDEAMALWKRSAALPLSQDAQENLALAYLQDDPVQSVVYCDSVLGEEEGRDRALYVRFLARRLVQEEASASH
ncbi:MAG: hypothetical protein VX916_05570 [Planctomycetota bacterium]|nr:hypothetical protein [Planctomycetota bacterium]